ncbi:hypothetical protein BK146_20015 [Paenibacillus sp. FSL R7-0333]|nr:hypothetical protein BK146_20015 [Paenibacillus sp. FSL R7-0333]
MVGITRLLPPHPNTMACSSFAFIMFRTLLNLLRLCRAKHAADQGAVPKAMKWLLGTALYFVGVPRGTHYLVGESPTKGGTKLPL